MQIALLPIRNRLTRRIFRLRGKDTLPLSLSSRRIYILPTRHGLIFGLLLLGMLLGSVNYGLSMGYLFTFLLLGMLLAGLFATWHNLRGLTIRAVSSEPAFAGDAVRFRFHLEERDGRPRYAIAVQTRQGSTEYGQAPAHGDAHLDLAVPGERRGRLPLGICRVQSEYPLGLFRAWSILDLEATALVWPRPAGARPLAFAASGEGGATGHRSLPGSEDFDGLRSYQPGESPARIAWKTLARLEQLMAKGFVAAAADDLWLAWEDLAGLDAEARLSQLARWVLAAERAGRRYGLRLPGCSLPPGSGADQRRRCLDALALHG